MSTAAGEVRPGAAPAWRFWTKALGLLAVVLYAGGYLMARFHIGIDGQVNKCLPPYTFFLYDRKDKVFARGDLIAFVSDMRSERWFPLGTIVIKRVVGLPGDHVVVNEHGAFVNGELVGKGFPLMRTLEKTVADFRRDERIPEGHYWVAGDLSVAASYDSRYWGYVKPNQIIGQAYALW